MERYNEALADYYHAIELDPSRIWVSEAEGLTDRSSTPHHIVVPVCHPGGQRRNAATRVHLPNSPLHHQGTSVAGMRGWQAGRVRRLLHADDPVLVVSLPARLLAVLV